METLKSKPDYDMTVPKSVTGSGVSDHHIQFNVFRYHFKRYLREKQPQTCEHLPAQQNEEIYILVVSIK
jgi:hypothetical protein